MPAGTLMLRAPSQARSQSTLTPPFPSAGIVSSGMGFGSLGGKAATVRAGCVPLAAPLPLRGSRAGDPRSQGTRRGRHQLGTCPHRVFRYCSSNYPLQVVRSNLGGISGEGTARALLPASGRRLATRAGTTRVWAISSALIENHVPVVQFHQLLETPQKSVQRVSLCIRPRRNPRRVQAHSPVPHQLSHRSHHVRAREGPAVGARVGVSVPASTAPVPKGRSRRKRLHVLLAVPPLVGFKQQEVGRSKRYGSLNRCYLSPCALLVFCIKIYVVKFMP